MMGAPLSFFGKYPQGVENILTAGVKCGKVDHNETEAKTEKTPS